MARALAKSASNSQNPLISKLSSPIVKRTVRPGRPCNQATAVRPSTGPIS
ncbi:hypothetical protein PAMC26510_35905 [Caballeronia sordidicola]|uniref:Uncharacterized protein n=1 Tax=Caballeronia sordidicola TaxID=196367 RepID=A0A242M4X4_CABSO|nr:hypothetical protein PAMC26510_35905 [Caballeronia sordidicola]